MEIDYGELGFKSGLEIHQQLEGKKLFCNCPTEIRKDKPDFSIDRRLRASAGEKGKVDIAALHEQKKQKTFTYQGYYDTTCLVEIDEEPPHAVNQQALQLAMQVAHMLHASPVEEIRFMRKVVVDGSNVSGFQRTALIATDGYITVEGKKISVPTICLEEEACQVIKRGKNHDEYNLSRLGIPLIEIATGPDISNPDECKEAALQLGMILRSVPGLKRGIGSIRQDVNVSITEGERVEIKGFQEVKSIPKVVEYEVERQLTLIKKKKKVEKEVRKAEANGTTTFLRPMPGAARMYPETDVLPVIPDGKVKKVELLSEKAEKLKDLGLGKDLADKLVKEEKLDLFYDIQKACKSIKVTFIAEMLVAYEKELQRENLDASQITHEHLKTLFKTLDQGDIAKGMFKDILRDITRRGALELERYQLMTDERLEKELTQIVKEAKGLPFNALMGRVMGELRGKADPKKVIALLKELTKKD
jgi:Glu-tRNA(Gln) amidotransferase subunit E-like FAD-binding protein